MTDTAPQEIIVVLDRREQPVRILFVDPPALRDAFTIRGGVLCYPQMLTADRFFAVAIKARWWGEPGPMGIMCVD